MEGSWYSKCSRDTESESESRYFARSEMVQAAMGEHRIELEMPMRVKENRSVQDAADASLRGIAAVLAEEKNYSFWLENKG
ncbi:hypothetical protein Tco_1386979 [Tanacetum coccineum]